MFLLMSAIAKSYFSHILSCDVLKEAHRIRRDGRRAMRVTEESDDIDA